MNIAQPGDMILLLDPEGKRIVMKLTPGQEIHTHLGYLKHETIIGHRYGTTVQTQMGHPYVLLRPSTLDLIMHTKRTSQIMYPKEIGYVLVKMNIMPGVRVAEAGTGSGALTLALARAVQPAGRVYSYEERPEFQANAYKNLDRAGLLPFVDFKVRDIRAGFDERDLDAIFLDVREPWLFLAQAHAALASGGFFGALVPTTNQVSEVLGEMEEQGTWIETEVCELLHRFYKPNAERLRPSDRMVAHTGYLIFARSVAEPMEPIRTRRERKYLQRQADEAEPETTQVKELESAQTEITEIEQPESEGDSREARMSEPKFVVVYKAAGELQAQIVKGRLTAEGIPAIFQNEALGTLGFTVDGLGEFRILVPEARETEARAILAETPTNPGRTEAEPEQDNRDLPGAFPAPLEP